MDMATFVEISEPRKQKVSDLYGAMQEHYTFKRMEKRAKQFA